MFLLDLVLRVVSQSVHRALQCVIAEVRRVFTAGTYVAPAGLTVDKCVTCCVASLFPESISLNSLNGHAFCLQARHQVRHTSDVKRALRCARARSHSLRFAEVGSWFCS